MSLSGCHCYKNLPRRIGFSLAIRKNEKQFNGKALLFERNDMKSSFLVSFFLLITAFTTFAASQKMKVPRLKTAGGAFKHLVLAQTSPEFVEKKSGITILRRYYIARWGIHRYEYGLVQYQCRRTQCEMLGEPVALKFYKKCTGFNKNGQPKCKDLESARVDVTDPYGHLPESRDKRHWYTCEDYGAPCSDRDELNEFPSRYTPEDEYLPTGI